LESLQTNPSTRKPIPNLRLATFVHALLFVGGFSSVLILGWGGAATAIGQVFGAYKPVLGKIGGLVVILFGLSTLKVIHIPWLDYETRAYWKPGKGGPVLSSVMMGVFFAAGWTPCIGTTLGAILTLGMSQQSAFQAMLLSSGYALGLGLPFLALGSRIDKAVRFTARFRRYVRWVEIASGVLLMVIGLMMLFDRMTVIAIWALQHGYYLDLPLGGAAVPTYFIAVLAGLLSFFLLASCPWCLPTLAT